MYDAISALLMEISQTSSYSQSNLVPHFPIQGLRVLSMKEMIAQGTICHEIIDQQPLVTFRAESAKPDKIHMLDSADCAYFRSELLLTLAYAFKLLDRYST
ncbi:hypothetical protein EUGRSUZ_L01773 [Eucalyptus grandis]|uniref:Uncharacterized protein n=1 Tax=Eucalyptus grandis TaxID=71139 RepID=A0A058ZSB8_EUCGR|nr:hypothetical protein EUGRSUZ_L01773 [Eucalyptus grandis]